MRSSRTSVWTRSAPPGQTPRSPSGASTTSPIPTPRPCSEVRQLGRTIVRWRTQIAAWHRARVSNGLTEAANNLIGGPPARSHDRPLAHPDRGVAPGPGVERADRSREQPDQAGEAGGVRVPPVRPLPDPGAAQRRPPQLGPTRHGRTPLAEARSAPTRRVRPVRRIQQPQHLRHRRRVTSARRCGGGLASTVRATLRFRTSAGGVRRPLTRASGRHCSALGGTRTPNLLIRRRIRRVQQVVSPAVVAGWVGCVFQQLLPKSGMYCPVECQRDVQQPTN